ncbi:hypothetical protein ACFQ07_29715, partial [Actinomadura adrarensis]
TQAFSRLLGVPVQRLATIAHGDGICTTHVSPRSLAAMGRDDTAETGTDQNTEQNETEVSDEESGRTSL